MVVSEMSKPSDNALARGIAFRCLAILLPLLLLLLTELGLKLFGWKPPSDDYDPFVEVQGGSLFELNESGSTYQIRESRLKFFRPQSFVREKPKNGIRIFCLGGSTVQGRPYSVETAFPAWLELSLKTLYPNRQWEVINCGGVSYASYRLNPIIDECLRYQADLIVICTGHNEFLEDRTYEQLKRWPKPVIGLASLFTSSRVAALVRVGLSGIVSIDGDRSRSVLEEDVDALLDYKNGLDRYHYNPDWRKAIEKHFHLSVEAMAEKASAAEVPMVLICPPSNLRDTLPFKSEFNPETPSETRSRITDLVLEAGRIGDPFGKVDSLRRAVELDPVFALAHFRLGQALLKVGRVDEAKSELSLARDWDVCSLRILSSMETSLKDLGRNPGVRFIDGNETLETHYDMPILGGPVLVDHVHPGIEAHFQLALRLLPVVLKEQDYVLSEPDKKRLTALFGDRMKTLEPAYFVQGQKRLNALRRWTQSDHDDQERDRSEP